MHKGGAHKVGELVGVGSNLLGVQRVDTGGGDGDVPILIMKQ